METESLILENLSRFFNEKGPYYTSYPTRGEWKQPFSHSYYLECLKDFFNEEGVDAPLHLYIHIPYCAKLCFYCICNIQVTNSDEKKQKFVDVLLQEIQMLSNFFQTNKIQPNIREIHFGGGTPSHLSHAQLQQIVNILKQFVSFASLDEFAMEIDPRTVSQEDLEYYSSFGVHRISFGVQDFDPKVQKAINRIQPKELVENLISGPIRKNFRSLNFDLLYGLPLQTRETFRETVRITNSLRPDRVTLLKYAHVPDVRKHMKAIKSADLPPEDDLPHMFYDAITGLREGGYSWIGIDNFALPTDSLAQAQEKGTVGRNFGGFTPGRTKHLIGLGPSTTSSFGRFYCQTTSNVEEYMEIVQKQNLPVTHGYVLNDDDEIRREVILSLICKMGVDYTKINDAYQIDFRFYFKDELEALAKNHVSNGNLVIHKDKIEVTSMGRYFVRNICKTFDVFHRNKDYKIYGP